MTAPFFDPGPPRDACGVGFIAALDRVPTYRITRLAVECLERLDHRGARAADGTGDGAGLLTQIPLRLISRELSTHGDQVSAEQLGVVMCFLSPTEAAASRAVVTQAIEAEGMRVLFWRSVPIDPSMLGDHARLVLPLIEQAFVTGAEEGADFERSLYLARKGIESAATPGLSIPSASSRTIVYKGLFTASHISNFYSDLKDPDYETAFAIFHQRYSTNTFPSWDNAQPFRALAHNGEINTIQSNRSWMVAREKGATPGVWGDRLPDVFPFLQPGISDSGSLDNVFELLMQSGRSLTHVKEMLMPAAWENVPDLDPDLASFYAYHAFLTEPWDGPAAIAATDGSSLLVGMDRNGLRPARWAITPEVVLVASEAGVCPEEEARAIATGQLGPGELIVFDGETGEVRHSEQVKAALAAAQPYGDWVNTETLRIQAPFDNLADTRFDAAALSRVFGYTAEERRLIIADMARGDNPLGSMGDDTGLAVLSSRPRRLTQFFHEMFAQVTNPPMDPIREKLVMSLRIQLGRRGPLLEDTPQQAHLIELSSPILSDAELEAIVRSGDPRFFSHWIATTWPVSSGPEGMQGRLDEICDEAAQAVKLGATILVLSDRETDAGRAPIPMLLALGAVHHHLIDQGVRGSVSLVVVSGEPRDPHDLACLVGFGASAVNPYLAIEHARDLAASGAIDVDPVPAQENFRLAMENGLLKIMSKMGICTLSAYRGSELFEVIGLSEGVCRKAFGNAPRRLRGIGLKELARQALKRHEAYAGGSTESGGFYKHRRGSDTHVTSPMVVLAVQKAVRSGDPEDWDRYIEMISDREPALVRDLLTFVPREAVPLDEVEPVEQIMRRFTTAAMSLGALSAEAHVALAEAMNLIGGHSNSGEGGEDPERFDTPKNSAIKQVASGRFGVTPAYLQSADELQIKMAQGSKPGEGGQLPGHKVSPEIARLRYTEPGVTLISPPPHHDIYSIEDLAQLIYDLKAFKPTARVSVKLVSEPGVGTIAVGVAKADADVITVSGSEGGTGASPLVSIKHAGSPWELGLAEAHQVLTANGQRSRVLLETDGGLRTGRDIVVAALLGAERFGFGTLPLLALGCKMVRQCHLNTCPVGIATQNEDLRAKFTGSADQVVLLFRRLAEEARRHIAGLGARSLGELVGRADLLRPIDPQHPLSADLSAMLVASKGGKKHEGYRKVGLSSLSVRLVADCREAIANAEPVELAYPIRNVDRAIGARLSGEITARHGSEGLPLGTIVVKLSGTAGQSFGAWLCSGVDMHLEGTSNDYLGKGMGGGLISVSPRRPGVSVPHAAGNAVLYGATGGRVFLAGRVGQRFAVRNSGATAVIEGCSDHGGEYMTGGKVLVIGEVGRNFAAGMTGGIAYVWDPSLSLKAMLADTAPSARRPSDSQLDDIRGLIEAHRDNTGSPVAARILEEWSREQGSFWVISASGDNRSVPVVEQVEVPVSP
jgi:glutamate synthase domain-containing protein 2/glutamate synthase domain-containing protein 1/glutamate synthase domain-containing protein 3